ncbi:MAG TPA: type II secretion system protein [Labilithrix sp.]|jgi:type IV pilus assembly protein PilA
MAKTRAFTLIELMTVVTLVGILATVAVFSTTKYVRFARTSEARNGVGNMAKRASTAFEEERMTATMAAPGASLTAQRKLCGSAIATVPAAIASVKAKKYQSSKADWSNATDLANGAGFPCLKFELTDPQSYMYGYTMTGTGSADGDGFTAIANGDVDGDGTASTYKMLGTIQKGRVTLAPNLSETPE